MEGRVRNNEKIEWERLKQKRRIAYRLTLCKLGGWKGLMITCAKQGNGPKKVRN